MNATNDRISPEERVRILLEDGCNVSVNKKKKDKDLPEWFDEKMFARGQKYFYANYYAMFVSKLMGLILVLTVPTILDVLIFTNKSSEPFTAFKRYLDTIRYMGKWYKHDVKILGSKSQKSLTLVNGFHCAASRVSQNAGLGLRITQKDMALTQFGFIGLSLVKKRELAIIGSEEDEMSFVHFWRTIGFMLGIEDKFNMCQGTLEEVRSVCNIILKDVYIPALKEPPTEFNHMVEVLIEGMKPISPVLDFDAFMTYLYEVCGVSDMEPRLNNWYSRWIYNIQSYLHNVLLTKRWVAIIFRPLLNYNMMFSVWINIKFPFGAAFKFGTKVFSNERHHPINDNNLK